MSKLSCGHPAATDAALQWCDRCDGEHPLVAAPAPRPTRTPEEVAAGFTAASLLRSYEALDREVVDPDEDPWLGDVHKHRSTRGDVWKAVAPNGQARMFRRRRDASLWLLSLRRTAAVTR